MITKSLFIFALIFTCITNTNAQLNTEFNYFSVIGGLTHSFGTFHEHGETSKAFITTQTYEQLISKDQFHFNYKLVYNLGFFYHHDFKNDDMGLGMGIHYQNYPYRSTFFTVISDYEVSESTNIHTVSLPAYFKYGKKFYEPMRYLFVGARINYHFKGKHFYDYTFGHITYYLTKYELNNFTTSFFIGFNYKILNFKIEYLPSYLITDSPLEIVNLSENEGHANNFIFINTNLNLPLFSYSGYSFFERIGMCLGRIQK